MGKANKRKKQLKEQRASVPRSRFCRCSVDSVTVHYHYTVEHSLLNFHVYIFLFFMEKITYVVYLICFCSLKNLNVNKIYIYI
jgi:hypothetical protein